MRVTRDLGLFLATGSALEVPISAEITSEERQSLLIDGEMLGSLCGGISGRRIRQLAEEGVFPKARTNRYDGVICVPAFWKWKQRSERKKLPSGDLDPEQQRARKEKELADAAALRNAVTRGELVLAANVEATWTEHVSVCRERLLGIPSKVGPALAAMSTAAEIHAALEQEIHTALAELSKAEPVVQDDE